MARTTLTEFPAKMSLRGRAQMQLLHSDTPLAAPPDSFDPDKMYRVQLLYSVPAIPEHPDGHYLRPTDLVLVSGAFANTIADAIGSAKLVGE